MRVAGIIGDPVRQSRSPLVHGHWLATHGLTGAYVRLATPAAALASLLADLGSHGLVGGNVTIPHKEAAYALVEKADAAARTLRAVNTLWLEGGRLHGANTDGLGFVASLDAAAPAWDRRAGKALVYGAGGAARSVVAALLDRGFAQIFVANRTPSRTEAIFDLFPARDRSRLAAIALSQADAHLTGADLVVNTTSLGMKGQEALTPDWRRAASETVAIDIVYVPLLTPFLAGAAAAGLRIVDGLGMLLHQAAPGFERWFGIRPVVDDALRARVIADIEGR